MKAILITEPIVRHSKKPDKRRMNYFHVCECGKRYEGFKKQTHCWNCIIKFLKSKGLI